MQSELLSRVDSHFYIKSVKCMTIEQLKSLRKYKVNAAEEIKSTEYIYAAAKLACDIKDFFADDLFVKVLIMYYCALMSSREIAICLKCSVNAVNHILRSGQKKIKLAEKSCGQ